MDHSEYIRYIPGSKYAVFMIHGIAGSPAHFRDLIPVIPETWSVYNILLDGHGKTVTDFGRSSMKKWKSQFSNWLEILCVRHERIVIVGHSMGTLFAIQAAIDRPERICELFLLSVPLCLHLRLSAILSSLRVAWGSISPKDRAALAMAKDTSIRMDRRLWKYITWAPRMLELVAECSRIRKILPRLTVPCQTFHGIRDEWVSGRSEKYLLAHSSIRHTTLSDSGHFDYCEEDLRLLRQRLKQTLEGLVETK